MASPVEERILDLLVTKLATITTGNGYEQTVASTSISRASLAPAPMDTVVTPPALQVRHLQTRQEPHLRGAMECYAEIEVIAIAEQDATDTKISALMADVVKLVMSNKRWHDGSVNLARRTWLSAPVIHETETSESPATGSVPLTILYRVAVADPYTIFEV